MMMDQLLIILKAYTGNPDPENASSSIANNNNNLQMPNANSQIIIGNQAPVSSTSLLDHMTQFQSNTSQPIVNIPSSNNNTNPILNHCFPVMANTPNQLQLPSGNFNSNCGGIDQSDMVSPIQNQLINLNLQNTFMGGLQHLSFNTPIDHINSPASSTTFSTQSSSSSPSSSSQEVSDNSSSLTTVQKKKKKKIAKANKMRETMSVGYNSSAVHHATNSSNIGSSSTDSALQQTNSTSTSVHFIHLSNEEMKIKYDSESSISQVKPKRKRGRPKKPEPTKPSSYEFIQDGWKNHPKTKK